MKKLLQKRTKRMFPILSIGMLLILMLSFNTKTFAQRSGYFSPWCESYMYQYTTTKQVVSIEDVWLSQDGRTIYHKKPDDFQADPTVANGWAVPGNIINTPATAVSLIAGQTYQLKLSLQNFQLCCNMYYMAWADYNIDYEFKVEECLNPDNKPIEKTGITVNVITEMDAITFTVPCDAKEGLSRIRMRSTYYSSYMNPNWGCNPAMSNIYYGETEDMYINIIKPSLLKADFIVPDVVWANAPQILYNKYPRQASYSWDKGFGYDFVGDDYTTVFPGSGKYKVKLRAQNCIGTDTIVKTVVVKDIPSIPTANFAANRNRLTEGDEVTLYDLSTYAPYQWDWRITNPNDASFLMDNSDILRGLSWEGSYYNAVFQFFDLGEFNVSLTATNVNGPSMSNKSKYIKVSAYTDILLGKGTTQTEFGSGRIVDGGGVNDKYPTGSQGKPTVNRLLIKPCGAKAITLTIEKFKMGNSNHKLMIWDGNDKSGTPLHPEDGFKMSNITLPASVTAHSGAMYVEFDASAPGSDEGLIASFETEYGATNPAIPYFEQIQPKQAYARAEVNFEGSVKNLYGLNQVAWTVDGFEVAPSLINGDKMRYTFVDPGDHKVCLEVKSCTGDSTFCRTVSVLEPTGKTSLDIVTSDDRPAVNQVIALDGIVDKADRFTWHIVPNTFQLYSGNLLGKHPNLSFTKAGTYSVSLRAWSSTDSAGSVSFLVKNNFIVAVEPCIPAASDANEDVSNNTLNVYDDNNNLIFNHYSAGNVGYASFLTPTDPAINLIFGKSYTVEMGRNSTADTVSRAIYIDFNSDGTYDASELVLHEVKTKNATVSSSFTVPSIDNTYFGTTRLRTIVAYGATDELLACGPGILAEYKDYKVTFVKNPVLPVITLNGDDTVRVEAGSSYSDLGATAYDVIDGDLTSAIVSSTNLDMNQAGIYFYKYKVRNSSGVTVEKTREIYVLYDQTAPVLTLNGNLVDTIEVNSTPYNDPWGTAFDNIDGDVTAQITVSGNVDYTELGAYTLTYSVSDVQGNTSTATRNVHVVDRTAPEFVFLTGEQIQLGNFWYDQTTAVDNYWGANNIDFKVVYGVNGPVQWDVPGTYPTTYKATDGSGNYNEVTRNYVVGDFIAPTVILNTPDTLVHQVKAVYVKVKPSIYDNYYPTSQLTISETSTVNPDVVGLYKEEYTVTDPSSNTTVKTRWVKVVDTKAPVISGADFCTKPGVDFNLMTGLQINDNYYTEGDLLPLVEVVKSNLDVWFEGRYYITYSVTDPSGNKSLFFTRNVFIDEQCDLITSIGNVDANESNFNVYPNPNSGKFTIDFAGMGQDVNKIEVMNSVGAVIKTIDVAPNQEHVEVDLSNEAAGIFLIRLTAPNGNNSTKKVIVNK